MTNSSLTLLEDKVSVRLAANAAEIEAAQRLRYKVFYEEQNAIPSDAMAAQKKDFDEYDSVMDHLVVVDENLPVGEQIVGTYRVMRKEGADKVGKFYSDAEFNIKPLLSSGTEVLELGRSCVLSPYRTRLVLQKLWGGIAHYVAEYKIGLMFGCACLEGTDVSALAHQLSYLYHYHLAPPALRVRAVDERYVDMNIIPKEQLNAKEVFLSLPPIIKGYLRLGASVGDGAIVDHQFNSTDVCIVMPTHLVTDKYFKHYQRITNNAITTDDEFADRVSNKESA
jgi:L-ornithine Nalpha-acyltransferase